MITSKNILIVGWPGQDAYFLKSLLDEKSNQCYLLARDYWIDPKNTRFNYSLSSQLREKLFAKKFDVVFFAQASHSGINSRNNLSTSVDTINSNTLLVAALLDIYTTNPDLQPETIIYFSSKLCLEKPVLDTSSASHQRLDLIEISAYTASKICSEILLKEFSMYSRSRVIILVAFNHESARRSEKFFIPRLLHWLYDLTSDSQDHMVERSIYPFNPTNLVDIGYAEEFMNVVLKIVDVKGKSNFEVIQLGTSKLIPLINILQGLSSKAEVHKVRSFQLLFHNNCDAAANHVAADLSYLTSELGIEGPNLYGYALGEKLAQDYIRQNNDS